MTVLAERDANAQTSTETSHTCLEAGKPNPAMDKIKQTSSMKNGQLSENGLYISPSDAILSPASQKLANFKQRQISKQQNPIRRTLFARTVSSASSASIDEPPTSS